MFDFSENVIVLLQEYPKLSQAYYALLEILAQDHMNFLSSLEAQVSRVYVPGCA